MKLQDISKELNISISTISRVINNKSGVSNKNRKLINEYLERKNLGNSDNNIIIIVPTLDNLHFCEVIKEINKELTNKNYQVLIYDSNQDSEVETKIINEIVKMKPKGVILCINDKKTSIKNIERLNKENIPVVLFDRDLEYANSGVFLSDFESGILAAQSLINKHCKEILLIHDSMNFKNILSRLNGVKHLLEKYKINLIEIEAVAENSFNNNMSLISKIIDENKKIDGIIILNESFTLEILEIIGQESVFLAKKNIVCYQIPKFISLINKNIKNITYSKKDMCTELLKLLLNKINFTDSYVNRVFVKPILI